MNNHKSLAHALQGEAKREYNKKYYTENADYWREWREKHSHAGAGAGGSWGTDSTNTSSLASYSNYKKAEEAMRRKKSGEKIGPSGGTYTLSGNTSGYSSFADRNAKSKYYKDRYSPKPVTAGDGTALSALAPLRRKAEERLQEEHEKRIRIRNRIASVYKLEWAEAQERAKRLPNRIINGIKNTISNIASTVVSAIKLGKK
jgi:hypothetical protein